jgi:hypothetical protein
MIRGGGMSQRFHASANDAHVRLGRWLRRLGKHPGALPRRHNPAVATPFPNAEAAGTKKAMVVSEGSGGPSGGWPNLACAAGAQQPMA